MLEIVSKPVFPSSSSFSTLCVTEYALVHGVILFQVNRLGLPVTQAEARLLVVEYGGVAGGASTSGGDEEQQAKQSGEAQLSLDDFDFMVRRQSRMSLSHP